MSGPFDKPLGLGLGAPKPLAGAMGLGTLGPPLQQDWGLGGILVGLGDERYRRRAEWNDRFGHWEKPATVSEEGTIERAQANVISAVANNRWFSDQGVVIRQQGSYANNTNVRTEADIDLRAVHPVIKVDYHSNVDLRVVSVVHPYGAFPMTAAQILDISRAELIASLSAEFGGAKVDASGKKAIRVKGITGSRAEVDVVPTLRYHFVQWLDHLGRYDTVEGVAILSTDGRWTVNFPEQHAANGVAKRVRTLYRFKKVVRILKRMRADMTERRLLTVSVPSFLVE